MKPLATSVLAGTILVLSVPGGPVRGSDLTAAEIVDRNVTARGGLEAWRKIETMVWIGRIENGNAPGQYLPFDLEMKRPNKSRFEIRVQNQWSVRTFDGEHGWKLRPGGRGKPDLQPYTQEEIDFARDAQGIDGPLIDYRAKGIRVALDGVDSVEGRRAYRLSVTLRSGVDQHVWVDAENYLDIKSDRRSRDALGRAGTISVYYRNYQTQGGLQLPFTIEHGAAADPGRARDKMIIDRILLNPALDDRLFARPPLPGEGKRVMSDLLPPGAASASAGPALSAAARIAPRPATAGDGGVP